MLTVKSHGSRSGDLPSVILKWPLRKSVPTPDPSAAWQLFPKAQGTHEGSQVLLMFSATLKHFLLELRARHAFSNGSVHGERIHFLPRIYLGFKIGLIFCKVSLTWRWERSAPGNGIAWAVCWEMNTDHIRWYVFG